MSLEPASLLAIYLHSSQVFSLSGPHQKDYEVILPDISGTVATSFFFSHTNLLSPEVI